MKKGKGQKSVIKKKIVPNLSSSIISRENKKRFRESYEKLARVTKRISLKKPVDVEMHDYVLPGLKPLVILLEEIMLDMEKQLIAKIPANAPCQKMTTPTLPSSHL